MNFQETQRSIIVQADNKKTRDMCKYISENGMPPATAEPFTFEKVASDWISKVRSNAESLHESDKQIIKDHGLFQVIFSNQNNSIVLSQIAELKAQIQSLMQLQHQHQPQPQPQPQANNGGKIYEQVKNAELRQDCFEIYKTSPQRFTQHILKIIKDHPNGVHKRDLHKLNTLKLSGTVLALILDDLITKGLVFFELTGDGKRRHRLYKSIN